MTSYDVREWEIGTDEELKTFNRRNLFQNVVIDDANKGDWNDQVKKTLVQE